MRRGQTTTRQVRKGCLPGPPSQPAGGRAACADWALRLASTRVAVARGGGGGGRRGGGRIVEAVGQFRGRIAPPVAELGAE